MKPGRLVIGAVVFLGAGLWMILNWCHGTSGLNLGVPVDQSNLHIELSTGGVAVLAGVPLLILGVLLLVIAVVVALASEIVPRPHRVVEDEDTPTRGFLSLNE